MQIFHSFLRGILVQTFGTLEHQCVSDKQNWIYVPPVLNNILIITCERAYVSLEGCIQYFQETERGLHPDTFIRCQARYDTCKNSYSKNDQYHRSGGACKAGDLLANDAKQVRVFADVFKSSFVPLTHLFAAILANYKPSSPRNLWNDHCYMLITDIRSRYQSCRFLLINSTNVLVDVLSEIRGYFSEVVIVLFLLLDSRRGPKIQFLQQPSHDKKSTCKIIRMK